MPKYRKLNSDLFPTGLFDENSCISRYQSPLYRKKLPRKASPYLISKLRSYEARHKKCGPYTELYNITVEDLEFGTNSINSECKYIVWIWYSGLGNRIVTLASAFLYALLTDRVLLVDRGVDIPDLFCEPFPETSWLLPYDFPLNTMFFGFNRSSPESYSNLLRSNSFDNLTDVSAIPPYVYLHLVHDYDHDDNLLCDQEQTILRNVSWLILESNNYFIPYLFLIPSFEQQLHNLFPDKESVFHLLGQYLFHPTNSVWGMITRYYQSYLSHADEIVGIQIRLFEMRLRPFKQIMDQIFYCTMEESILPKVNSSKHIINSSEKQKTVAVLMTSLDLGYFDVLSKLYREYPTETGEVISVYQPTHEQIQQSLSQDQNRNAWAEMYLLSLTDKLVTTAWSTFGYVAQGLGDLKPWILYMPENEDPPDPPCTRAMSIEPCFHDPLTYDCKMRRVADTGALVPHVRHCEDVSKGLKLVNTYGES